jgi:hypothetical protein
MSHNQSTTTTRKFPYGSALAGEPAPHWGTIRRHEVAALLVKAASELLDARDWRSTSLAATLTPLVTRLTQIITEEDR